MEAAVPPRLEERGNGRSCGWRDGKKRGGHSKKSPTVARRGIRAGTRRMEHNRG
jgi:hypothetical protein